MDRPEPDFIVVGEKVALGPLRRDLAADYARWLNDPEVRSGLNQMGVATPQSQEAWVEQNLERGAKSEPEAVEFTVYDRTDAAPVGTARASNAAGLAAYERAGFHRIGVRRGARISRGQPTDLVLMDAVPQDFGASA